MNEEAAEFLVALLECCRKHANVPKHDQMSAAAYLVGGLMAEQDIEAFSPDELFINIMDNMQAGNHSAASLKMMKGQLN